MRFEALVLALAACDNTVIVRPVIDHPTGAGDPFPMIDKIELSIAIAGEKDDLQTGKFSSGETLVLPEAPYGVNLVNHMLGKLGDDVVAYGRTCPFAIRAGEDPPTPHLYFAPQVSWAPADRPPSALRAGGTAFRYRNTGIFIGGTDDKAAPVELVDRFDALQGAFDPRILEIAPRRFGNVAILGNGSVVIAGGVGAESPQPVDELEVVQIDQSVVKPYPSGGLYGVNSSAFTTLADGRVISFGGRDMTDTPIGDLVEIKTNVELRTLRAKLAAARFGHTATSLSDAAGAPVLVAGGVDATRTPVVTAELYKPLEEQFEPGFAPRMVVPRSGHQAIRLSDGTVLIIGGLDGNNNPVTVVERFSLEHGFAQAETLPLPAGITDFTATPLPDGRVLLAGGKDYMNRPVNTAFIAGLDPVGGGVRLVTTSSLQTERYNHQATSLCDGTVLVTGGTLAEMDAERYNPVLEGRR